MDSIHQARLAQSVEHQTWNLRVVGSSPTVDKEFFILYFVASDALLAGQRDPMQMKSSMTSIRVIYVHRERES